MSKFKAGDKVWVKPLEEVKDTGSLFFASPMKEYCERAEVVSEKCGYKEYRLEDVDCKWIWAEDWLESEEEHQMRVNTVKDESKVEENKMKFKDLKLGDMFTYSGFNIFTKTRFCMMEDDGRIAHICPIAGKDANFVGFVRVYDDEEVTPINVDALKSGNENIAVLATKALEHFGNTAQICQTMEECAELIVALNKSLRDPENTFKNVLEELADVTITLEQMKQLYDVDLEFDDILKEKMSKLGNYLSEQEADE